MAVTHLDRDDLRAIKSTNDHAISMPIPAFVRLPFRFASAISSRLGGELARLIFFHPLRTRPNGAQNACSRQSRADHAGFGWPQTRRL